MVAGYVYVSLQTMALACPDCGSRLNALMLKKTFACPSCGARLRARTATATANCIGAWLMADFLLMLVLPAFSLGETLTFLLRVSISAGVGLSLFGWAMPALSAVERAP